MIGAPPRPLRVTYVMTHPVQYMSPWFRYITARRPEMALTVLYGAVPSPSQQGREFAASFTWDVPLTDGYRYEVCRSADGAQFESGSFFGIDVPDIGARIAATVPDAVVIPGWHSVMQVRALRACRRRFPTIYRGDTTLASGPSGVTRLAWAVKTRAMLAHYDVFMSVGAQSTEYLRRFGVPAGRIVVSPHAVDNAWFADAAAPWREPGARATARAELGVRGGDFVVLFAGKFVERKRGLDAVRAVAAMDGPVTLLVAGGGPQEAALRTEAQRLGVRTGWTGFLNQSALPRVLAAADCLLVPSLWETWGLIVNEAMAVGLPCVVTSGVAAAPDLVVPGRTGYVVPPRDVAAMAARLTDVRAALVNGVDMAAACRAQVAQCSFTSASAGLVDAAGLAAGTPLAGIGLA